LHSFGEEVDVAQVYGGGTTMSDSSLSSAIQFIGTTRKAVLLLRPGAWTIAASVTVPSNLAVVIPYGAVLTVSSGKTLTFNGPFEAGSYQVFSGTGSVLFGLNAADVIRVAWWDGTGPTLTANAANDHTAAIQAAVDAAMPIAAIVELEGGHYTVTAPIDFDAISSTGRPNLSGMTLRGQGIYTTYIDSTYDGKSLNVAVDANYQYGFNLKDLCLTGPNVFSLPYSNSIGIYMKRLQHPWRWENVFIWHFGKGFSIDTLCGPSAMENVWVSQCTIGGDIFGANSDPITVSGCTFFNNATSQLDISAPRCTVTKCGIYPWTDAYGIRIKTTGAVTGTGALIEGNRFELPTAVAGSYAFITIGTTAVDSVHDNIRIKGNSFSVNSGSTIAAAIDVQSKARGLVIDDDNYYNEYVTKPIVFRPTSAGHAPYGEYNIGFEQHTSFASVIVDDSEYLGRLKADPRSKGYRDVYQDLKSAAASVTYTGTATMLLEEDKVLSNRGVLDAYLMTLTASTSSAIGYTVTGDDTIWSFSLMAKQSGATPLNSFALLIYNSTDAKFEARQTFSLQQYWREYAANAFLTTGKTYVIYVDGHGKGSGTSTGSFAFTTPLVRKSSISGTLLYTPWGTLNTTAANIPYNYNLPQGAVFWSSGAAAATPAFGTVIGRHDTTLTADITGTGAGTSTISVAAVGFVVAGDYVRLAQTVAGARKMINNTTTGYTVTATGAGTITFSPGLANGVTCTSGDGVQVYRYGDGADVAAWTP